MFPSGFGAKKNTKSKSSAASTAKTSPAVPPSSSSGIHMFTSALQRGNTDASKKRKKWDDVDQQEEVQETEVPQAQQNEQQQTALAAHEQEHAQTFDSGSVGVSNVALYNRIPISQCSAFKGHSGVVSAFAIDHYGNRFVTGSHDYSIKFWDFAGMNQSLQSFREKEEVCGSYPINHISFSPTSNFFVIAPDAPQPKILDRDGFDQATFKKGDQYLCDKTYTKGHTAAVTGLKWHPTDEGSILTGSTDSTLRLWNVETCEQKQENVLRTRTSKGTTTAVTTCTYNADGSLVVAGCIDGSIQIWQVNASAQYSQKPNIVIRTAHESQREITSITFSRDGNWMASRSIDETVKLWDMRNTQTPLFSHGSLPNSYNQTDVIFSPDDRYLVTGTSIERREDKTSRLLFFDTSTHEIARETQVPGSTIRVAWHAAINQVFATSSSSETFVFYDRELSRKGVLQSLSVAAKKKNIEDFSITGPVIIAPGALPMFKPEPSKKKQKEKAQKDRNRSHKPDTAPIGKGKGGMVAENLTHLMLKNVGYAGRSEDLNQDPREALLKYANDTSGPSFAQKAYEKTQPVPIFDYSEYEQERKTLEQQQKRDHEKSAEQKFKKPRFE